MYAVLLAQRWRGRRRWRPPRRWRSRRQLAGAGSGGIGHPESGSGRRRWSLEGRRVRQRGLHGCQGRSRRLAGLRAEQGRSWSHCLRVLRSGRMRAMAHWRHGWRGERRLGGWECRVLASSHAAQRRERLERLEPGMVAGWWNAGNVDRGPVAVEGARGRCDGSWCECGAAREALRGWKSRTTSISGQCHWGSAAVRAQEGHSGWHRDVWRVAAMPTRTSSHERCRARDARCCAHPRPGCRAAAAGHRRTWPQPSQGQVRQGGWVAWEANPQQSGQQDRQRCIRAAWRAGGGREQPRVPSSGAAQIVGQEHVHRCGARP